MSGPPPPRSQTWSLSTGVERDHWDRWSALVLAARHPALARIEGATRDEDTATLTLLDGGSESIADWAERVRPSVPERLAVLRAAAAALDALYAGTADVAGVAHGAVSTTSIRVAADGSARVIGFSPWVSDLPQDARFRAPELGSGAPSTRAGDSYAFARTVAEVLGGAEAAEAEDPAAVVRALRASPDTRRRARLIKAVGSALTDPPEARPHPLTSWLAAATDGTVATEMTGTAAVPADPVPETVARALPRRGRVLALAAAAAAVVVAGLALYPDRSPATNPSTPADPGPYVITSTWAPACGAGSGTAGAVDLAALHGPLTAVDLDSAPDQVAAGRWHNGRLLIRLSAGPGHVGDQVASVEIERVSLDVDPPAWLARPAQDCDVGPSVDQRYAADLDTTRTTLVDPGPSSRFAPHGAFRLTSTPVVIGIDAAACRGNYLWRPVIHLVNGAQKITRPLPAVYLYGQSRNLTTYQLGTDGSAPRRLLTAGASGEDLRCGLD